MQLRAFDWVTVACARKVQTARTRVGASVTFETSQSLSSLAIRRHGVPATLPLQRLLSPPPPDDDVESYPVAVNFYSVSTDSLHSFQFVLYNIIRIYLTVRYIQ